MSKALDLLTGIQVLEKTSSPTNKNIEVVRSLAFGTYIQVDGLTQSGGVLRGIWKQTLKKVKSQKSKVKSCLILGLGGGSLALLLNKVYPEAKITGVDIDPKIVKLGKNYLKLDTEKVNVVISDAMKFVKKEKKAKKKYDLILTDLYVGYEYPREFESENYMRLVGSLLADNGVAVFNRLYFGDKRSEAIKFGNKLEKMFSKVDIFYPQANIMFICRK
jgi:spermidine synthase